MKATLRQILNATPAFDKLVKTDLPSKMRFRARNFVKQIQEKSHDFQVENRTLVEKYGILNEKGVKEVMPEQYEPFGKEIEELLNEEIELKEEDLPDEIWDSVVMSLTDEEAIKPFKKVKE